MKLATQASCSLYFSRSFTKIASLIFSCLVVKPKSTYFSLINLIIERGYSRLLRTYLIFLDQRWFCILILNISQSFRLTSFRIETQAIRLLLILTRLIGGLQQVVYSRQSVGLGKTMLLGQFPFIRSVGFDLIYSLAGIGSFNKLLLIYY